MSNYYGPCFYRIDDVVIPFYIELPWNNENNQINNLEKYCSKEKPQIRRNVQCGKDFFQQFKFLVASSVKIYGLNKLDVVIERTNLMQLYGCVTILFIDELLNNDISEYPAIQFCFQLTHIKFTLKILLNRANWAIYQYHLLRFKNIFFY